MRPGPVATACKRCFDIAGSSIALIVFFPCIALIAIAIRLNMGKPIFFRQVRPGLNGRPFTMLKFRTMVQAQSLTVDPSTDAARLTQLGSFLRRFSLDELPQLWLVLIGKMSLVGPRPLLLEYLPLYTTEQAKRHLMKPGVTGLTQIKGRNALSWDDKFQLDVWYVEHWSFWLDLRILLATAGKAIRGTGIHQQGHATTEKFGAEQR